MRGMPPGSRSDGQASTEFAIILGVIAVGCIVIVLILGAAITGQIGSNGDPSSPSAPFLPPTVTPGLTYPTSIGQCENGGWKNYPQFGSEAECVDDVKRRFPQSS